MRIVVIDLDWPASNGDFDEVNLRGNTIWDDGENNPPTYINSMGVVAQSTADITALHITGSFTAQSKVYDGNFRAAAMTTEVSHTDLIPWARATRRRCSAWTWRSAPTATG